jgi:hypothetical protein
MVAEVIVVFDEDAEKWPFLFRWIFSIIAATLAAAPGFPQTVIFSTFPP